MFRRRQAVMSAYFKTIWLSFKCTRFLYFNFLLCLALGSGWGLQPLQTTLPALVTVHYSLEDPFHQTDTEEAKGEIPGREECHRSHQEQNCLHHWFMDECSHSSLPWHYRPFHWKWLEHEINLPYHHASGVQTYANQRCRVVAAGTSQVWNSSKQKLPPLCTTLLTISWLRQKHSRRSMGGPLPAALATLRNWWSIRYWITQSMKKLSELHDVSWNI